MSLSTAAAARRQSPRPAAAPDSSRERSRVPGDPIRVAVVDDDAEDRLMVRLFLQGSRSCRFTVEECEDPRRLMALLESRTVDVILMDQRLGPQHGTDVIRRIGGSRAPVPSILLTGADDAEVEEAALVAGAADHLSKSDLSSRVLERTIKYAVKWHSDQQELRRQGEQLQLAWNQAAQANRTKSVFLASMSHELRTPLNAIIGFSTMLLDGSVIKAPGRVREYARSILEGGQQLLHLVNNLLDIARIEAGQFLLRDETLDIHDLLREVVRQNEPLARQHGIDVLLKCPARLPAVSADGAGLQQVFLNLLSNGIRYTNAGGRVRITVASADDGLRVTVRDTGIGMAQEEIETVLQPFMRLTDSAYVRSTEGTGLGLAIVAGLADQLGLRVGFDSRPGRGTTVTVTIPPERLERPLQSP